MIILVTNDDGIDAPGLQSMVEVGAELGDVWVVAPLHEQSSQSHALTIHTPLRVLKWAGRPNWFGITGTPVDCVFLAVHHILPERPKLILSGINRGANLGDDVHYSGTVAAAIEGSLMGIPALAVSLVVDWNDLTVQNHWATAASYARIVTRNLFQHRLRPLTLLNLNVPDIPLEKVKGLQVCRLGRRHYHPKVEMRMDPLRQSYYWIGAEHAGFHDIKDSDGLLLESGYATLSPLSLDMTAYDQLQELTKWS